MAIKVKLRKSDGSILNIAYLKLVPRVTSNPRKIRCDVVVYESESKKKLVKKPLEFFNHYRDTEVFSEQTIDISNKIEARIGVNPLSSSIRNRVPSRFLVVGGRVNGKGPKQKFDVAPGDFEPVFEDSEERLSHYHASVAYKKFHEEFKKAKLTAC